MPITISVTPDSTQNSFVTLEEYKVFLSSRLPYPIYTDSNGDAVTGGELITLINSGDIDDYLTLTLLSSAIEISNGFLWNGSITFSDQNLSFPRKGGLRDKHDRLIDEEQNPVEIKSAQMEYGAYLISSPDLLLDSTLQPQREGIKKVKADVEIEFQSTSLEGFDLWQVQSQLTNPEFYYLRFHSSVLKYIPVDWYKKNDIKQLSAKKKPFMVGL